METDVTFQHIPDPLTSEKKSVPTDIKAILCNYDFECMSLFRSHEEYFADLDDLVNLRKNLQSCRTEAKLTTIHDKSDLTPSCTSDNDRKTVISFILEQFLGLLEENSKLEENF